MSLKKMWYANNDPEELLLCLLCKVMEFVMILMFTYTHHLVICALQLCPELYDMVSGYLHHQCYALTTNSSISEIKINMFVHI
jgi:hypothetical protein